MIKQVGNYGEIFERHLGLKSPLKLERRLNNLATKGGCTTRHHSADADDTFAHNRNSVGACLPSDLFRGSKDGRTALPWFDKLTTGWWITAE
jgi:hypothetical protein